MLLAFEFDMAGTKPYPHNSSSKVATVVAQRGLGRDAGHFAKTIIREILGLAFFNSLQNEAGDEFGLVTLGVMSRGSAACWIAHPVLAEVRRRDEWVDFADDDAVLFQLGACGETKDKQRSLRSRVHAVLRNGHKRGPRIDVHDASATLGSHHRNHGLHRDNRSQHIEMEDFVKQGGIDLFYCGCIATPCIIYEPVDAAVMLVHGTYGFPHSIRLRHVYRERQAAWKLLRQFFQRIGAASEKGDFRAAIRQSDRRR